MGTVKTSAVDAATTVFQEREDARTASGGRSRCKTAGIRATVTNTVPGTYRGVSLIPTEEPNRLGIEMTNDIIQLLNGNIVNRVTTSNPATRTYGSQAL